MNHIDDCIHSFIHLIAVIRNYCEIPNYSCDLGMYYSSSFELSELYYTFCEVRCDNDEACVAFIYENGGCFLKDSCSVLENATGSHIHIKRTGTE